MSALTPDQLAKQELYRDARSTNKYDDIWQSVGKCVFCDLNEKYVFFEEHGIVMTISLYAYIDGHFMIIPRRHVRSAKDLTEIEWATIRKFMYMAKKLIKSVHKVKGVQFVQKDGAAAQSTVEHIHYHCVPFDSPDLLTWNYRKLQNTPLENAELYKQAKKKIITSGQKFEQKYEHTQTLEIVCDVIIQDTDRNILFEERADDAKLQPNYITLPGGKVSDISVSLESELVREIKEEIGLTVHEKDLQLVSSRIDEIARLQQSSQLDMTYPALDRFVRNTYTLQLPKGAVLRPGDDAKALIWVKPSEVSSHKRISPPTKTIITKAVR